MTKNEKNILNFDDLVSKTKPEVLNPMTEKAFEIKQATARDKMLAREDDNSFITKPRPEGTPEVFKEVFFGQTHKGKELEIEGLNEQKEISDNIKSLKPITEIFNLAREMKGRSKRISVKEKFYNKEDIKIKNDLVISESLFVGMICVFLLTAILFAIFKNRLIMIVSFLTMAGTIFTGIFYYMRKEASAVFNSKKIKFVNDDINEIRIRLRSLKEDVTYFQALRMAEKITNFELEFSTKVNHIMDLINEYEHIHEREFEKREEYYNEIMKTFEDMTKYEKSTFDKYFYDKFKK